jgi:hypothetical protein
MAGLYIADFFTGVFFILLTAWEIVFAAFSVSCAAVAVCLFTGIGPRTVIPFMPFPSGLLFGFALVALFVLSAVGCVYFALFLRQLIRAYGRFRQNTKAAASGSAVLPSLQMYPQLPGKTNRFFRYAALLSIALFAVFFVLGIIVSMISAGAIEFWHAWKWFGYTPFA